MRLSVMWRDMAAAGALCLVVAGGAWAQTTALPPTPPNARQALEVLLGSLADTESVVPPKTAAVPATAAGATPVPVRQRVVVRPGETLDGVLRRTLSHLPIKESVLRAAFVDINPDAFVSGSVHRLRAGAEMQVPSPEDVRRIMLRDAGGTSPGAAPGPTPTAAAPAAVAPKTPAAPEPARAAADPLVEDMRDWVRYP